MRNCLVNAVLTARRMLAANLLCLCFAMPAVAAVCNVPSPYATIQAAVDDAACTDIELAAGTFSGATVNRDLTIRGQSRAASLIQGTVTVGLSGNFSPVVLSLRQLSVTAAGSVGVLLDSKFAELDGEDILISGCATGVSHGPFATDSLASLRHCEIRNNARGILARKIAMDNCSVILNAPQGGIAVGLGGTITNSTVSENENTFGVNDGGGIVFDGPGGTTLTIEDSTISTNVVDNGGPTSNTADGGGIMIREGFLFLRRSHILGNVAGRFGGGLAMGVTSGVAEIEDSTFSGNVAYEAGGGLALRDRAEIRRSLIENNRAWFNSSRNANGLAAGGGIYVVQGRLDLIDSTVRLNRAEAENSGVSVNSGGGLYINTTLPVTIENSTINGNFAEVDAGGLFINSATTMTNTTIAGNSANRNGGGIVGQFTPVITHGTVVQNTADADNVSGGDGGGIYGNAQVSYSLIGYNIDNSAAPTDHPDCSGGVVSTGYSFLRIGDGCLVFDGGPDNQAGGIATPLDLMLALPLTNNGGPAQTVALNPGSPAIDGGDKGCEAAPATDQRGYSRLAQDGNLDSGVDGDPCDIGAFELFNGCQAGTVPLLLTNVSYSGSETIQSETSLTTGAAVVIRSSANVEMKAVSSIGLGNGLQVVDGAEFKAVTGPVSCN